MRANLVVVLLGLVACESACEDDTCIFDTFEEEGCTAGFAASTGEDWYTTVQEAVDEAEAGDTVTVCPGTWTGNVEVTKDLTVQSEGGAEATVLDGGGAGSVVSVSGGASVTLKGLTLTGGTGTLVKGRLVFGWLNQDGLAGGGLLALDAGTIAVEDSVIKGNYADHGAGFLALDSGAVTLTRVDVVQNEAEEAGGGGYMGGGDLSMVATTIRQNTAAQGGGLAVEATGDVDVTLAGDGVSAVEDNTADSGTAASGGGVAALASGGRTLRIADLAIFDNVASLGDGGGVWAEGSEAATFVLEGLTVSSNITWGGSGGGAYVYQDGKGARDLSLEVRDSTFEWNAATAEDTIWPLGGGLEALALASVVIESSTFRKNTSSGWGGGVSIAGVETCAIDGSDVSENTSSWGAGLSVLAAHPYSTETWPTSCVLTDVTVGHNGAEYGGGLHVAFAQVELVRTDITGNWTDNGAGITMVSARVVGDGESRLASNTGYAFGGGILCYAGEDTTGCQVEDLVISGNASGHGGAVANLEILEGRCDTLELAGVAIDDNRGAEGAAIWAQCPVCISGSTVTGNETDDVYGSLAGLGGGAWLEDEGTLTSTDTDWGTGSDDNSPEDVSVEGTAFHDLSGFFACDPALQSCWST